MGYYKKLFRFRKLLMFFWLIILPITFNWMSPVLIIMGGFDGFITMSFIIFTIWFLSSLFFGRAFCAYGCQWGASQEILGDAVPKILDPSKKNKRRKIKYVIFIIWIAFVALGPIMNLGYIYGFNPEYPSSPGEGIISFDAHIGQLIFYFGILGSVVVLFTIIGGKRSFCNYACPMGVLGILGTKIKNSLKYPSLHLEVETEKCIKCKQCSKACEMGINVQELVQSGNMYNSNCILCGGCISTCKQNVINYAWKWKQ